MNILIIWIVLILLEQHRYLTVQAGTVMISYADCKSKCLGQAGKTFCPSFDKKQGQCCGVTEAACPRDFGYCSADFKNSTTL